MNIDVAILFFVLAMGAFIVPLLTPRLGLPEAVGQIIFGIIAGGLGLANLVHDGHDTKEVLHVMQELGFILLMFGAGLEIDFDAIERGGAGGLLRGLGVAFGVVAVSAVLTLGLGLPVFYVVVLSATSIGLGVVVLRETGLSSQPTGQALLLIGALGELLTLIAMTVFYLFYSVGLTRQLWIQLGELAALFVVGAVFLRFLKAWTWWHPRVFARVFAEHDPSELGVRAAIAACLGFVALAVVLKVDPVLGAFLAGAVSRMVFRDVEVIEHKMSALSSGFFIPIFFIYVGLTFDVSLLSWEGLRTALLLGSCMVAARLIPCAALLTDRNLGPRDALGVALLLGAPLTLLVAIAKLGEQIGVIDDHEGSALVLLAILLSVLLPVGFRQLFKDSAPEPAH
ncbi:MAG: cation:proton antiporter [Proteobacteria bacterium]|nr:cation:proton antiporter [Pseudomonadota bacterium]